MWSAYGVAPRSLAATLRAGGPQSLGSWWEGTGEGQHSGQVALAHSRSWSRIAAVSLAWSSGASARDTKDKPRRTTTTTTPATAGSAYAQAAMSLLADPGFAST